MTAAAQRRPRLRLPLGRSKSRRTKEAGEFFFAVVVLVRRNVHHLTLCSSSSAQQVDTQRVGEEQVRTERREKGGSNSASPLPSSVT